MDHWGDPWADNANEQKSPARKAPNSPLPVNRTSAPVVLNGFLDDAGWGNEDEGFGDWTTSSGNDATAHTSTETRVAGPSSLGDGAIESDPHWHVDQTSEQGVPTSGHVWARQDEDIPHADTVPSETSDTSTTIPIDERLEHDATTASNRLQPDDDDSARPSTSPSEASRNDAPAESPRTSFEEEGVTRKSVTEEAETEEDHTAVQTAQTAEHEDSEANAVASDIESDKEDDFGTFAEDTEWTEATTGLGDAAQDATDDLEMTPVEASNGPNVSSPETTVPAAASTTGPVAFTLDSILLNELFPAAKEKEDLEEAPDDPIYSTSGRRAWYRLTRKETMREFNGGNGDDNYIRVTWAHSQVRSEVNKTVGRWAREDRLSGTGPGARASFYWDTPAPVDSRISKGHLRTKTSVPTQRAAAPVRQSLPPVSTNTPAAFNWSSPTTATNPWDQHDPRLSTSSSITQDHGNADTRTNQELGMVSIDLKRNAEETLAQTWARAPETPTVSQHIPAPMPPPPETPDPRGPLSAPDTNNAVHELSTTAPTDDDDEWGEMIGSPIVSTSISTRLNSTTATRDNASSFQSSTPQTPPNQSHSAEKMHIVRLRSTISPTSAIFAPKSFVPLHAEQVPIGPGLLKPAKRPVASTPGKKSEVPSLPDAQDVKEHEHEHVLRLGDPAEASEAHAATPEPIVENLDDDEFTAFASSTPPSKIHKPSTPPPPPAALAAPMIDSWADADLSFFDIAPPSAAPAPQPKQASSSGPFSVLGTPPRPTSSSSSAKTFTRSPPRNLTPPPIQPLTGATNSAQRRKNEEEQLIRDIVASLPDLSYMLR